MNSLKAILVLVTLPFLISIGYDAYLNIVNEPVQDMQLQDIKLSAVGFILTKNIPESLTVIRDSLSPGQWDILNKFVLTQKTLLVTGVFAGFFYILAGISWIFGIGVRTKEPVSAFQRNKKTNVILGEAKEQKYGYKRK